MSGATPLATGADETSRSAWAAELAFAAETALAAGRVLMDRYERLERIDHKSARDVVTEADHQSEALIIAAIRAHFPADAILAEESGAHPATPAAPGPPGAMATPGSARPPGPTAAPGATIGAARDPNGRVWVIDPLDGTVNYANGLPVFCASIGLVVDGTPVTGVVLDPTRSELFAASADGPATLNGRPIRSSGKEKLSDWVVSLSLSGRSVQNRARAIRREIRISRSMGSAALALAYVGNGRFDAFVQESSLSLWDVAAAGLIAERGGAVVSAFGGGPWYDPTKASRSIGAIAAAPAHHARIVTLANAR